MTVPVRRGGIMSLLLPIPPETISFHATAVVHRAGSVEDGTLPGKDAQPGPGPRTRAGMSEPRATAVSGAWRARPPDGSGDRSGSAG